MKYGLIGEHLGHSYSREIHGKISTDAYELLELAPDEVAPFLEKREFCGINVTIPYKQTVMPLLDTISEAAARIGAVNTIVNRAGKLYGYNTDFAGMRAMIQWAGMDMQGKKVLILGSGGTSRTARAVVASLGATTVLVVSRRCGEGTVSYEQAVRDHADAQFIVNTTPVGMYPNTEQTPVDLSAFGRLQGVIDAIYHPLRTRLVLDAQKRGVPAVGGLYMLAAQAVYAAAIFRDREPDPSSIERVYRAVLADKQNLVLIGMPSSGKTTVGRELARRLGKRFVDTDEAIVARIGQPIADYFAQHGEAAFRTLEREVIAAIAKDSGCVIATGGGAVLSADNVIALQQNAAVVFLDRHPSRLLVTADRPLSSSREAVEKLYQARYPLYRQAADVTVDANGEIASITEEIIRRTTV